MHYILAIILILISPMIVLPYALIIVIQLLRDSHYVEKRYWKIAKKK